MKNGIGCYPLLHDVISMVGHLLHDTEGSYVDKTFKRKQIKSILIYLSVTIKTDQFFLYTLQTGNKGDCQTLCVFVILWVFWKILQIIWKQVSFSKRRMLQKLLLRLLKRISSVKYAYNTSIHTSLCPLNYKQRNKNYVLNVIPWKDHNTGSVTAGITFWANVLPCRPEMRSWSVFVPVSSSWYWGILCTGFKR